MSRIHKVLQQSGKHAPTSPTSNFNPLSEKPLKQPRPYGLVILSGCLVIAIIVVIFWPMGHVTTPSLATIEHPRTNPDRTLDTVLTEPNTISSLPSNQTVGTIETKIEMNVEPVDEQLTEPLNQSSNDTNNSNGLSTETSEIINQDLGELVATRPPTANEEQTSILTSTTIPTDIDVQVKPESQTSPIQTSSTPTIFEASSTAQSDIQLDSAVSSASEVSTKQRSSQASQSVIQTSQSIWASQVENSLAQGQIEQAEIQLKQWIGAAPNDPTPRIWLARIYISNGAEKAAEPLLVNLTSVDAQGLLGIVYERTERPILAAAVFENLYRAEPRHGQWLLFWAVNSERSSQFAKSQQLYQTYLNLFQFDDTSLSDFAKRRLIALGGPQ